MYNRDNNQLATAAIMRILQKVFHDIGNVKSELIIKPKYQKDDVLKNFFIFVKNIEIDNKEIFRYYTISCANKKYNIPHDIIDIIIYKDRISARVMRMEVVLCYMDHVLMDENHIDGLIDLLIKADPELAEIISKCGENNGTKKSR